MSNLPEAGIYVYNLEVASRNEEVERITESDDWWEFNVSEQFPIKSVKKINEKVDIKVGDPHEGCIIRTIMMPIILAITSLNCLITHLIS